MARLGKLRRAAKAAVLRVVGLLEDLAGLAQRIVSGG